MLSRSQRISEDSLRRLHPTAIDDPQEIRGMLDLARRVGATFHRGLDSQIDLEVAKMECVDGDRLVLRTSNFEPHMGNQVFLNFKLGDRPYFFSSRALGPLVDERLTVEPPSAIYCAERRDRARRNPVAPGDARRVIVRLGGGRSIEAEVTDVSPGGMGLLIEDSLIPKEKGRVSVRFLDGAAAGDEVKLTLRNQQPSRQREGWSRIGLNRAEWEGSEPLPVERRTEILEQTPGAGKPHVEGRKPRGPEPGEEPIQPRIVRFENPEGEELVGILDSWGETRGAPAVLIPTGWGQTKESLLPLARTIVSCFRSWGQPVTVLRFDGVRQRGESHNDPLCRLPGREYHHFTFSQGVRDIDASLDYLEAHDEFCPSSVTLVSFSIAAISSRRAVALDEGRRIANWISVVGSPDMQSAIRAISGGVDLAAGFEQGLRFGMQELLGVAVDTDRIGVDANEHEMVFLEDSRRDFAKIRIPVTWFHGEHDAWMDLERVRDVLSQGDQSRRRLATIPTGHQIRSSKQASDTFQCVAAEVGRMLWQDAPAPVPADPRDVRRRWLSEGRRRRAPDIDLRAFWSDYLLGRDGSLGIELMTHGSHYRRMMDCQIDALDLGEGDVVADLGSGTGSFPLQLGRRAGRPGNLQIQEFDCVREGLRRARTRIAHSPGLCGIETQYAECDLDLMNGDQGIPARSGSFDAVLASLLISYVDYPILLLREIHRILRPGGRLVISSLCRDADFSRLYMDSLAEVQIAGDVGRLPEAAGKNLPALARSFLNDAARILELEEAGSFQMWDPDEFIELVSRAGFEEIRSQRCLGDPPQAVVLSAVRG